MSAKESCLVVEKLRDETVCCICTETFSDPRLLPCSHTFCLKCLIASVKARNEEPEDEPEEANEQPEKTFHKADKFPCPVCRQCFAIPDQGLTDLPKNFFMMRLIDITRASRTISAEGKGASCDACTGNADPNSTTVAASAERYCIDCRQKLCKECSIQHKKNKMTKLHTIVSNEIERGGIDALDDAVQSMCDEHRREHLIYCENCTEAVCPLCFVEKHGLHKGMDANKLIEKFRQQVDSEICDLSELIVQGHNKQEKVKEEMDQFSAAVEMIKEAVFEASKREKERIDRILESVQKTVDMVKEKGLEEMAALGEGLDYHIDELEGYRDYCNKIKSAVTMRDVNETLRNITDAALQMKREYQVQIARPIPKPGIPDCELLSSSLQCVKGNVDIYNDNPVLIRKFRTRAVSRDHLAICGIALLGNALSVVHSYSPYVTVYNAATISFHYEYTLAAVRNPRDLTSCRKNNCLYILDEQQPNESYCIRKVTEERITSCSWDIGNSSGSLMISLCGNVILAIEKTSRLKEYTPGGYLLYEIVCDPSPLYDLRYAVQHRENMYVICYSNGNGTHGVCLLDVSRKAIVQERSDLGLKFPACIVLDEAQNVLVVDRENKRVVVLCSSSLSFKRELITSEHGLESPQKILLDESCGRLFVLDECSRILVFDVRRGSE